MLFAISLMNMRKIVGPRVDPWRTQIRMSAGDVVYPPTINLDVPPLRKPFTQVSTPLSFLAFSFCDPIDHGQLDRTSC